MTVDKFAAIRERERREIEKSCTLLALGDMEAFDRHALSLPAKFSGPFPTEAKAAEAMVKLVKQPRGPGQVFYLEERPEGWHVMARLTDPTPMHGWCGHCRREVHLVHLRDGPICGVCLYPTKGV